MINSFVSTIAQRPRSEITERDECGRDNGVTVALFNNVADGALQATERQFCALLSAASVGLFVRLKFYSMPGIARSDAASAHIGRYYEDFAGLQENPPDGIIVTGTEPCAKSIRDEPYWPALSWLVEWADKRGIPSIWSCLAAHAAVLEMDGIERYPLGRKLSGLFECRISPHKHHILHGLPAGWRVPHSRHYGLRENSLIANGYNILSQSREVGPDIFLRQGRALQLFFQGHPEYRAATLMSEYRRDVTRFLNGERSTYPAIPIGYYDASVVAQLAKVAERAMRARKPDTLAEVDAIVAETPLQDCWAREARRIFINWLSYVSDRRACPSSQTHFAATSRAPYEKSDQNAPFTQVA